MEQGFNFDDEENDFNAIKSSVTKRKLRIESDSENENECDSSSNVKNNKLIESDHSMKGIEEDDGVLEKERVNIIEHAMEGIEEDTDISNMEDKHSATKKTSGSGDEVSKNTANSDSEDEFTLSPVSGNNKKLTKSVSKRLALVDSDSEDSEDHNDTTKNVTGRSAAVHSDSEDEHSSSNSSTNKVKFRSDNHAIVDEGNKNGELISEDNPDLLTTSTFQKSRLSALYDSESSEDESRVSYSEKSTVDLPKTHISKSRKPKLPAKPKEKKMTPKEALQQRQEITSESQRMLRESRVSLPYHIPKARSIKEFLQNRPKFASPLSQNTCQTPPSMAMKMSVQQLEVVVKKLEERNKELEKYYESESESEEEEAPVNEPAPDEENMNEDNDNLNTLDETNNQNEHVRKLDVMVNLPTRENNQNEENLNEIDEDVNTINEPSKVVNNVNEEVAHVEENHDEVMQEIDTIHTEEMVALVMPDTNSEAEISNLSGLELSTEIIEDIQNKTDLEEDKSVIQNKSNPILEDTSTEIHETEEIVQNKFLEDSGNSMAYDFNLDDMEESEGMVQPLPQEKMLECDIPVEVQQKDVEDEHFQRILKKYEGESANIVEKKLSLLQLVKQKYGDTIPCLKGAPGEEIDLDDTGDTDAISELKERFIKHAAKKHIAKHKVHLDVINLTQGEIHKETVAMSVDADEEPIVVNETPGSKLRKLKKELEMQMARRRFESWKQRQSDSKEVEAEEKADYETEAILDDEGEAELTDGDSTEGEIEDNEMPIDVDEESKNKYAFLDDQAEEDDDEENAELNEVDELNEDQGDSRSGVNENEETEEHDVTTPRKPRRLLIRNLENSDSDDEEVEPLLKKIADDSLSSTDTAEADEFPPNLPFQNRNEKTPSKSKSQFSFLTPVQQLTGLQSLNSGSKFLNETSPALHSIVQAEPSPLKEISFSADEDTANSQMSLDEEHVEKRVIQENSPIKNTIPTTQDLLNICSGSFSVDCDTQNNESLKSQTLDNNTCITVQPAQPTQINLNISEEVKNLDEDNFITQLLNEDELEQFKKKFNSPLILNNIENETYAKSGRLVIDSSDEENEDKIESRKKPKKKLDFSDDESDVDSEEEKEEEIDLHENISEDEELEDEESSNVVLEYDSEENEIEVEVQEKKNPKSGVKSREFFENEAELSESDWDSEDEDEKGLDVLETEQGDADVFDEDQVRNDLEKIHMRRVLDQDNQEIKMLQELLLEDGELHGTGRQKQFRWRNIDDMDNEEVRNDEETDLYLEEDESEEQWRKVRHEREMFLKSKTESSTSLQSDSLTSSENDSQILKLGEEALRKGSSKIALEKSKVISNTIEVTKPFAILNTRGSFLARSDQFLNKLAEINKVTTSVTIKNAKKIVFETRSIDNGDPVGLSNGKKRKASEGTPSMIKKLRLSSNLSPNVNNVDRRKKLFN